jgi:N-methylhydantoinase A
MGLSIEDAAAGMYRIVSTNMAQGVREISIKRGFDAREFPLVVAGGAGPAHSCLICEELRIPLQIIPREASVLCAAGMLMCDLRHDLVRTFVSNLAGLDWDTLNEMLSVMERQGNELLEQEGIREERRSSVIKLDCRYRRQYHEVSVTIPARVFTERDSGAIAAAFHARHNRLYGYALEQEGAPVEIINVRLQAVGEVEKPGFRIEAMSGADASHALKGERPVYVFEDKGFDSVPIYDGHRLIHGNRIPGPAMIEQVTTAIFISKTFDCVIDKYGSFVLYRKDRPDLVANTLLTQERG